MSKRLSSEEYQIYRDIKAIADKITYAMDTAVEDTYVDELINMILAEVDKSVEYYTTPLMKIENHIISEYGRGQLHAYNRIKKDIDNLRGNKL